MTLDTSPSQKMGVFQWPLDDSMLIEASAGTGKTWTIAALYLRVILETEITVDELLVVTYTEAATKELRGRIRSRLDDLRAALESGHSNDPLCSTLLDQIDDRILAQRRVEQALSGFDQSAIFTIHGFCQRVLSESALNTGVAFNSEVLTDESELRQMVLDDFWRTVIALEPRPVIERLISDNMTPEKLAGWFPGAALRPDMKVIYGSTMASESFDELAAELEKSYAKARSIWFSSRDEIVAMLLDKDVMNGTRYRTASVAGWASEMDIMLSEPGAHSRRFNSFIKFTREEIEVSIKKNKSPPEHAFFDTCSELGAIDQRMHDAVRARMGMLHHKLREALTSELTKLKVERGLLGFDDLLLKVQDALVSSQGALLASELKRRYPAAMIDEFQDTDPVQLDIFTTIYQGEPCLELMVGDPKQAIYSFRGADLFAYIKGRESAHLKHSLDTNYRSDPVLVNAVNAIMGRYPDTLVFSELEYPKVQGIDENRACLLDTKADAVRLSIRFLERRHFDSVDKPIAKKNAEPVMLSDLALEIARLIEGGAVGEITIDASPLVARDIAVLVRTHVQAAAVHAALKVVGVPAVRQATESVFNTAEADSLEHIMRAVIDSGSERRVRSALASHIIGMTVTDLERLTEDVEIEATMMRFRSYHLLWHDHGFMVMIVRLFADYDVYPSLLKRDNGERILTNVLHLCELVTAEERAGHASMEQLAKWLSVKNASADDRVEESQIRLESDADRVQIVTVHKSKGLEYPVVFCPYLWDVSSREEPVVMFHDPHDNYQACIDVGSDNLEAHRAIAERESFAENIRLAYVALTRARQRCYLYFGAINHAGGSSLAWLFHLCHRISDDQWTVSQLSDSFRKLSDADLMNDLEDLVASAGEGVSLDCIESHDITITSARSGSRHGLQSNAHENNSMETLSAKRFSRVLRPTWQVSSFTSLSRGLSAELPDRDIGVQTKDSLVPEESSASVGLDDSIEQLTTSQAEIASEVDELSIHAFPRGAVTGVCWHSLFERIEFSGTHTDKVIKIVQEELSRAGFDLIWTSTLVEMVNRVRSHEFDEVHGFSLSAIKKSQQIREMGFFFRVNEIRDVALSKLLMQYGAGNAAYAASIERLEFELSGGFIRGFIDLIVEYKDRYYVIDYKSNYLGPAASSYQPARLDEIMVQESYTLQYLLYVVALHRYLKSRRADYRYESHFGGVYYLFLRGMGLSDDRQDGVFHDRPDADLIEALDRYFSIGGDG
ncbi:MAG: RecBCD enzyme subunit RecB [marine bacterium B5-7]|nr:MAG: RecBCD enzyme subunit RecB [marine bacterium B5-7]